MTASDTATFNPPKAGAANVAIVCNSLPPYRLHLHRRIDQEISQINLWTVCTHETIGDNRWDFVAPPEIRPVNFGKGESHVLQIKPSHGWAEWRKAGRIIRWIIENDVRGLVMLGYNDVGRMRLIRWCRRNDVACLLWGDSNIWGDNTPGLKGRLKARIVRYAVGQSAALLACGDCGKAYFRKYGAKEDRIFYHPYEPDYNLITGLGREKIEQVQAQYQLPGGRRRIIFSGRMIGIKRPDLALQAFVAIAKCRPQWDLIMAGDGLLREQLMQRVPEALKARITWTGFINDQAGVSALYRLSDVLVLPSDFEPWALVVNEAACAGLAIVCSSVVGAATELVRDGVNGRVFPAGDLSEMTQCLRDVTDPRNIDAMKAASPRLLAAWRKRGDPVEGLRQALVACGVIAAKSAKPLMSAAQSV